MRTIEEPEARTRDVRRGSPTGEPRRTSWRHVSTRTGGLLLGLGLVGFLVLLSISVGAKPIALPHVWEHLVTPDGGYDSDVVHDVRLPRTLAGLAVGAALGLAGALMQALTRNPLADPGLLGVNAGAFGGVVLAVGVLGLTSPLAYVWFAFAGAAAVSVVVYALGSGGHARATPVRLALAGTAVGAVLTAVTSIAVVTDRRVFDRVRQWNLGSLAVRDVSLIWSLLPFVAVGCVAALALGPTLNAIALGDEAGRGLGARLTRTRVLAALAVMLLCGAATAMAGPIGFVGLLVPHLVRAVTGPDQRWVLPYAAVGAMALLLGGDVVGRLMSWPGEVEVGIVTAVLGGPALVLLVRRSRLAEL